MRIAIVNGTAAPHLRTCADVIHAYSTLTGWSQAVLAAGATQVRVVQRFPTPADRLHEGVEYAFRSDRGSWDTSSHAWRRRLIAELRCFQPDVIHVNGTRSPLDVRALVRDGDGRPVVVQHHGEPSPRHPLRRFLLRRALTGAGALVFSTPEHAALWRRAGVIGRQVPTVAIMESSTTLAPVDRSLAKYEAALPGAPACLWVGRLNSNKDPLTVLAAFDHVRHALPDAHLTFVYQSDGLLPALRHFVDQRPSLQSVVHFRGAVAHDHLPAFYCAADLFVLGSHHEGSGYALIEALACGLTPVVTDIPSFRCLTDGGRLGALWRPGSAIACAAAILTAAANLSEEKRCEVRAHFDRHFTWQVLGGQALTLYRRLAAAPRASLERHGLGMPS